MNADAEKEIERCLAEYEDIYEAMRKAMQWAYADAESVCRNNTPKPFTSDAVIERARCAHAIHLRAENAAEPTFNSLPNIRD